MGMLPFPIAYVKLPRPSVSGAKSSLHAAVGVWVDGVSDCASVWGFGPFPFQQQAKKSAAHRAWRGRCRTPASASRCMMLKGRFETRKNESNKHQRNQQTSTCVTMSPNPAIWTFGDRGGGGDVRRACNPHPKKASGRTPSQARPHSRVCIPYRRRGASPRGCQAGRSPGRQRGEG